LPLDGEWCDRTNIVQHPRETFWQKYDMRRSGIGGNKLAHVGQADNTERNAAWIIGIFPLR